MAVYFFVTYFFATYPVKPPYDVCMKSPTTLSANNTVLYGTSVKDAANAFGAVCNLTGTFARTI
jgi:hypothetical protein